MKRLRPQAWGPWGKETRIRRKRRAYVPRQRFRFRQQNALIKATRAMMMMRKLKKEEEVKFVAGHAATMQIPIGGNWIVEGFGPYMQQGQTVQTRIGNKISVQSVFVRFLIKLTALEATGTAVRLVILIDRRPVGANATSATVMYTDNQINSTYNLSETNKGRFQILMDQQVSFGSTDTMKGGKLFHGKPQKILYTGNAGTVADVQRGNYLILAMAEGNAAAIDVDYGFIIRFTDA